MQFHPNMILFENNDVPATIVVDGKLVLNPAAKPFTLQDMESSLVEDNSWLGGNSLGDSSRNSNNSLGDSSRNSNNSLGDSSRNSNNSLGDSSRNSNNKRTYSPDDYFRDDEMLQCNDAFRSKGRRSGSSGGSGGRAKENQGREDRKTVRQKPVLAVPKTLYCRYHNKKHACFTNEKDELVSYCHDCRGRVFV